MTDNATEGNMQDHRNHPSTSVDSRAIADFAIADMPILPLTWPEFHEIIRLLLLSHNAMERRIIGLHFYHKNSVAVVAEKLKITESRVDEIIKSLLTCENMASKQRAHEKLLARASEPSTGAKNVRSN